jgi:hypothetical protein
MVHVRNGLHFKILLLCLFFGLYFFILSHVHVKNGLLKSRLVFFQKCFWYNESLLFEETKKASWLADHWTEHCASGFILYFKDFLTVGQRISPYGIFQRKSIQMKIHCGRCVAALNVGWFPSIH